MNEKSKKFSELEVYDKLMQYALRIISKKRYTEFEMEKKLNKFFRKREFSWGNCDENLVDQVIKRLFELKYLDDEKYAQDYIATRLKLRPRGNFLLEQELRIKGLSSDLVKKILNEINIDEFEIALELLSSKKNRWDKHPLKKQKEKAYYFLASRGFKLDAIYKALGRCYNPIA